MPSCRPPQRHAALAALRDFGHEAAFLAPQVRDWHDLPATRRAVKVAILTAYPAFLTLDSWYVPQLFAAWRETADSTHDLLSRTIRKLDCDDAQAIQILVVELSNPSEESSSLAAELLIRAGSNALPADTALAPLLERVDGLQGSDNHSRLGNYLELVRAMGPHARKSRAELIKLIETLQCDARKRCAGASDLQLPLHHFGGRPHATRSLAIRVGRAATATLQGLGGGGAVVGALGPAASEATPLLVSALDPPAHRRGAFRVESYYPQHGHGGGDFTTIRLEAIRDLSRIGSSARAALPALRLIAGYQSPDLSQAKAAGYAGLEDTSRFIVPRLEAAAAQTAIEAIALRTTTSPRRFARPAGESAPFGTP